MKSIKASEFKARCLEILDEVARTGDTVAISKRGRVVAELVPPRFGRVIRSTRGGPAERSGHHRPALPPRHGRPFEAGGGDLLLLTPTLVVLTTAAAPHWRRNPAAVTPWRFPPPHGLGSGRRFLDGGISFPPARQRLESAVSQHRSSTAELTAVGPRSRARPVDVPGTATRDRTPGSNARVHGGDPGYARPLDHRRGRANPPA
jgi:prevent-host-death family protein